MNLKQLLNTREKCREQMLNALEEFVRENGEEMSDYYRNEHGIDEDYYGYDVVKILDTAEFGCYFPLALQLNDDSFENATEIVELEDSFGFHAYWSFYIARDRKTGEESLMYYKFYNSGIRWSDEESEPDHDYASELDVASLDYIFTAIECGLNKMQKKFEERLSNTAKTFIENNKGNFFAADIKCPIEIFGHEVDVESIWHSKDEDKIYIHCGNEEFEGDLDIMSLSDKNQTKLMSILLDH